MVDTGGQARHPAATDRILRYWASGPGAIKIRWGTPGDHSRCVRLIQEEITSHGRAPLPDHEIHGLCANLQKRATGSAHDSFDNQNRHGSGKH